MQKTASGSSNAVKIKKLKRNRDPEADRLLDWIVRALYRHEVMLMRSQENGVRDSLHKGYLKTLTLSIFADPERTNDILECYKYVRLFLHIDGAHPKRSFHFTHARRNIIMEDGSTQSMTLPEMAIGNSLSKLTIAPIDNQALTVREVKLQIQNMTRRCVSPFLLLICRLIRAQTHPYDPTAR